MKNMSTKMKLILSFSVIVVINVCFGYYSLHFLDVINGRVVEANVWTEGIAELGDMQYAAASLRRYDLNYVQQTEENQKQTTFQNRAKAIRDAEEMMNKYRDDVLVIPYDTEEQRREDLAAIELIISNLKAYLEISQKLLKASDAGNLVETMALVNEDSHDIFADLEASITALIDFNKEGCATVTQMSEEIYQSAKNTIAAVLLFTTAFSVAVPVLLVKRIKKSISELLRVSEAIGQGALTVSAEIFSNDEFGKLASQYNSTIANIKSLVSNMQETALYMAGTARDFHESASHSSAGTDMIAQNIEQVSIQAAKQRREIEVMRTSINVMVDSIADITGKLDIMAQGAAESVQISNDGWKSMQKAISQMNTIESAVNVSSEVVTALGERSNEIGLIVGTISAISSQTNLLALNAAIEAARAGDQGRGFAVVAEEVKKLASESQSAAEEISHLISSIQEETSHAVKAMISGKEEARKGAIAVNDGGSAFNELAKRAVRSSDALTSITELTHKLSSDTSGVASAVHTLEGSGREIAEEAQLIVAATAEQSSSMSKITKSSQQLANISTDMLDLTRRFTV
ncbi:MAG: methyl-accepting chemotaxis protein [Synergistaceae bacterium]|nr:methyl-accepting chemotaxis protein [Synergistaceae bacterium]